MDMTTKIEVEVSHQKFVIDTGALAIDRNDLDKALTIQAKDYAWYRLLYERCRAERVELEADIDDLTAEVSEEIRPTLPKGATETAVKAKIGMHPKIRELSKACRRKTAMERELLTLVEAVTYRKECVKELSRSRNLEMSSMSADEVERAKRHLLG